MMTWCVVSELRSRGAAGPKLRMLHHADATGNPSCADGPVPFGSALPKGTVADCWSSGEAIAK
ncbi:uncharacterized protein N7498_005981 [Penicillium cinerascens]|uniref:Uncharacterized protein n=1 Tax=Penicillium cinerascens TaxID=70096 RepID=A0A9W9MPT0_9EURO|nr:uncharacterized protein N7498_005981 [Penicillium cinerascens]KAJ5205102.1 hypothetical protein N7498_005981 [Penicillium cinerascens]